MVAILELILLISVILISVSVVGLLISVIRKRPKRNWLKILGMAVVIDLFLMIYEIFFVLVPEEHIAQRKFAVVQAGSLIVRGELKNAAEKLSVYRDDPKIKKEVDEINNIEKNKDVIIKNILVSLSDEDFVALSNGNYKINTYSNDAINTYITKLIKDTPDSNSIREAAKKEKIKKDYEDNYMNPWDGSNIALTKYIKANMNNPDNYKHIETSYFIDYKKNTVQLVTKFRDKNAFYGEPDIIIARQNLKTGELKMLNYYQQVFSN